MTLQPKRVIAGVYQPANARRAYGRHRDSYEVAESVRGIAVTARTAPDWLLRKGVPMPRGGERLLLRCQHCHEWALRLYPLDLIQTHATGAGYACRTCLSLHYQSQYQGRRLEAHPEMLPVFAHLAQTANSLQARARYQRRYEEARAIILKRRAAHAQRVQLALDLALATLLARIERRIESEWRRSLPVILRDVTARQYWAQHPDTPVWAREALHATLPQNTKQKSAAEGEALQDLQTLAEDLHKRYAALSPQPRNRKAA